uniref:Neuropeptide Y receptor type 4-like n=1 Tax=Saccoglossus kowalevskii TaxID=10224 RepID=A0ABM0MTX3_SACKO|nr:PREDICTED: neuropeptide Y receptor type 4-like [Saccoglossus kowalevskii]
MSSSFSTDYHDVKHSTITYTIACFLGLISAVTILGNFLTIASYFLDNSIKSNNSHIYLVNLAIADLLVGCISMPLGIAYDFNVDWLFGETFCKMRSVFDLSVLHASVFSIVLISCDRYCLVTMDMRYITKHSRKQALFKCITTWILAFGITIVMVYGCPLLAVYVNIKKRASRVHAQPTTIADSYQEERIQTVFAKVTPTELEPPTTSDSSQRTYRNMLRNNVHVVAMKPTYTISGNANDHEVLREGNQVEAEMESFPNDPRDWSTIDVSQWLSWTTHRYNMVAVDVAKFHMNGKGLSFLRKEHFVSRAPSQGVVLFQDFRRRLVTAILAYSGNKTSMP